jgi:hypothetical protein
LAQGVKIECYPDNEMQMLIMNNFDALDNGMEPRARMPIANHAATMNEGDRRNAVLKRPSLQNQEAAKQ